MRDGFARARVTDIAGEAGVSLSVMYRHFGSKADLLREAILSPFLKFLEDWMNSIEVGRPRPSIEVTRNLVAMIFDNLQEHRGALSILMASDTLYDSSVRDDIQTRIGETLSSLSSLAASEVRRNGLPGADVIGFQTRLLFGMILGVVVWEPWILGADAPDERDDLIDGIARMAWYGTGTALGSVDREPDEAARP